MEQILCKIQDLSNLRRNNYREDVHNPKVIPACNHFKYNRWFQGGGIGGIALKGGLGQFAHLRGVLVKKRGEGGWYPNANYVCHLKQSYALVTKILVVKKESMVIKLT